MKVRSTKQLKTIALVLVTAGLSMGNESCQQAKDRVLKLDVEVGKIAAQPITLPTGEVINFPYIANALYYRSVMNSDHFVMMNPVPAPSKSTSSVQSKVVSKAAIGLSASGDADVSSADTTVLSNYHFLSSPAVTLKSVNSKVVTQAASAPASSLPVCLYDLPQAQLKGEVVDFEADFGVGIGIGYGANGQQVPNGGVSGNVKFNSSRLDVGMRAEDPLNQLLMAAADGISHQSTINLGVSFNPGIPIGLDLFFKTPLASVVTSAFDKGLNSLIGSFIKMRSNRGSWDDVWESRVMYDPEIVDNDTYVAFRGGYRYGMMKGDTFYVTNMYYKWEADPCTSALKYKITRTPTPVAELEVVDVGDNVAVAKVTKYLIEQRIEPGAQVMVNKLIAPVKPKTTN